MSSPSSKSYYGNVGDAVFYDSSSNSFVFLPASAITSKVDSYTPIGVVAIPTSHDVYGDGTCGVVSLVCMCEDTPDIGTGDQYYTQYFGGYFQSTSLAFFDCVNYISDDGELNDGSVQGTTDEGYLPYQINTDYPSLDGEANYYLDDYPWLPSPYNSDGSRNVSYYTKSYSVWNALSDFDGLNNTKILTDLATAQFNWKTATAITNNSATGYYPAACCAWRFHTAGTNQGQWYLPACGEMGYVINRISAINTTINKVLSVYSSVVAVAVHTSSHYWSSSEVIANLVRSLVTYTGNVYYNLKDDDYCARAFLRI